MEGTASDVEHTIIKVKTAKNFIAILYSQGKTDYRLWIGVHVVFK